MSLHDKKLIYADNNGQWTSDFKKIKKLSVTSNVVDILKEKIEDN